MKPVEIRCTCSAHPILAIAKPSDDGQWFVHVKVFKQRKVYAELVMEDGNFRMKCRSCESWFTLNVRRMGVDAVQQDLPARISL